MNTNNTNSDDAILPNSVPNSMPNNAPKGVSEPAPKPATKYDKEMIRRSLAWTCVSGMVYELRTLGIVWSGYFDDLNKMANAAQQLSGAFGVNGVFCTINPCNPDLLARANNRIRRAARNESTAEKDIVKRVTFLIDVDSATRPSGISATDDEKKTAFTKLQSVKSYVVVGISESHGSRQW